MADAPATESHPSRRWLFRLAWVLLAASLLYPAPSDSPFAKPLGISALHVYGTAAAWGDAVPGSAGAIGFWAGAVLTLALFSNIAFLYTLYLRDDRGVSVAWKVLLSVAFAVDAGVALLVPELARLPAYWIWLAAMVALAIAYVGFGGDALQGAQARKAPSAIDRGDVPPFVWVLLGCALFWVAVSAVNHAFPPPDAGTAAIDAPLTGYVNDRAQLLSAVETSRLTSALQQFEAATPGQVAVAIYPRAPAGSIDEFTIRAAERLPLGRAGEDTGAILFIFMDARAARLEIGYGLEGVLTDAAAHRLLETQLAPAFARGSYFDGLDATLRTIFVDVQDADKQDRLPGKFTVWQRKLEQDRPKRLERMWRAVNGTGLAQRVGIVFLGAIIGIILWSVVPLWVPLGRDVGRGVANLRAGRPFRQGIAAVDGEAAWDSLRLLVWAICILVPTAGVIIVAGGGAFGGAGSFIRW
jgi:uncharacterized membrane protein YgcG